MTEKKVKIGIGFKVLFVIAVISLLIISSNIIEYNQFSKELSIQSKNFSIYQPSIEKLDELNKINIESISLLKNWVFIDKDTGTVQKKKLEKLFSETYPAFLQNNHKYDNLWDKDYQNAFLDIVAKMDKLKTKESLIMDQLSFFEDYQNTELMFEIFPLITENGEIIELSKSISTDINALKKTFSDIIIADNQKSVAQFDKIKLLITWFTILIVVFLIILSIFLVRNVVFITTILNSIIKKTKEGYLPEVKTINRKDEVGELNNNLQGLIAHLSNLSDFANEIGQNKFDTKFKPASDGDVLGNALLRMRDNLVKAQNEAKSRQEENSQRNWASQGIAEFNEVIRDQSNNLEKLTYAVIETLVNYTKSNIGGLFIVNENDEYDKFLELKAFYAYDRHKYIDNRVEFGETLIGQCYVEKDTIYITEVPDDYMYITSGLGTDKPRSILIVPLQFNEVTYGVIELASFKTFEDYKIEFIEKISETIASAISTAKINQRTSRLLEESNEKSKRLEHQEVQARENIAKVGAQLAELEQDYKKIADEKENLQKEISQKERLILEVENKAKEELKNEIEKRNLVISSINQLTAYYEMSNNGTITYANKEYAKTINVPEKELVNLKHIKLVARDFVNTGNYKKIWDALKDGKKVDTSVQYLIDGKNRYINEVFIPVTSNDKIVKVAVFIKF